MSGDDEEWLDYLNSVCKINFTEKYSQTSMKPGVKLSQNKRNYLKIPKIPQDYSLQEPSLNKQINSKKKKNQHVDAVLDLHGYDLQSAFQAVRVFIMQNYSNGNRNLLIITGIGKDSQNSQVEEGVLRRELPMWLENSLLSDKISSITNAHNIPSKNGGFYIKLRKLIIK